MITSVFYILGFSIIVLSLLVLVVLNPIHKVAYLCAVFLNGAFLFLSLDFYFLGLTYIIVYVGAIAIIFLFVIMMIKVDLAVDSLQKVTPTKRNYMMDLFLILSLIILSGSSLSLINYEKKPFDLNESNYSLYRYLDIDWTIDFETMTDIISLANTTYIGYPVVLIIIGLALWVVMVGIIKLTLDK